MKTTYFNFSQNLKAMRLITFFLFALGTLHLSYGQTNTLDISGIVINEDGPLPGVNITLKGENVGVTTDVDGKFTFPVPLKIDDVLIFSYLGYVTQKIKLNGKNNYIKLRLEVDMVEMLGSLDSNTPYKSKRKNN